MVSFYSFMSWVFFIIFGIVVGRRGFLHGQNMSQNLRFYKCYDICFYIFCEKLTFQKMESIEIWLWYDFWFKNLLKSTFSTLFRFFIKNYTLIRQQNMKCEFCLQLQQRNSVLFCPFGQVRLKFFFLQCLPFLF